MLKLSVTSTIWYCCLWLGVEGKKIPIQKKGLFLSHREIKCFSLYYPGKVIISSSSQALKQASDWRQLLYDSFISRQQRWHFTATCPAWHHQFLANTANLPHLLLPFLNKSLPGCKWIVTKVLLCSQIKIWNLWCAYVQFFSLRFFFCLTSMS